MHADRATAANDLVCAVGGIVLCQPAASSAASGCLSAVVVGICGFYACEMLLHLSLTHPNWSVLQPHRQGMAVFDPIARHSFLRCAQFPQSLKPEEKRSEEIERFFKAFFGIGNIRSS